MTVANCLAHSGVMERIKADEVRLEIVEDSISEVAKDVKNIEINMAKESAKIGAKWGGVVGIGSVVGYKVVEIIINYLPTIIHIGAPK